MKAKGNIRVALVAVVAAFSAFTSLAQDAAAKNAPAAGNKTAAADAKYKPIAEARAKIGDIIANPAQMTEVLRTLSPEDQKAFVADVNAAIAKLPGSTEDKTAKFLNVNRAAFKGASAGNMANLLAVTFASVPPEALTVLCERYASDLFNRDADPSHKFTDAAFEKTAMDVVGKVAQATAGSDDAGVRNTLAIIMFAKASNGTIDGLTDRLVETMPDAAARELAKKEWIPAAMAEGDKKSYEALLAYADAGRAPNLNIVLDLAGPQILDAMLVDITSGMNDANGYQTTPILDQAAGGFGEARILRQDDLTSAMTRHNEGLGAVPRITIPRPRPPEPPPYAFTEFGKR